MLTPERYARLAAALPYRLQADPALAREVQQAGFFVRLPAGRDVFTEGQEAGALALLISGRVRVYKIGETGRELTLYRFGLGEARPASILFPQPLRRAPIRVIPQLRRHRRQVVLRRLRRHPNTG